jgi:phage terminase large subunit
LSTLTIPTPRAFLPLLNPARYKGAYGGRGSAKSHSFAGLMIEENIVQKQDNVCLREIQKSLEFSVKKLLELKISDMNAGAYFEVQDKRILTKRGGIIIFEGLQNHTSDSIKSLEGFDRAWVEEAQTLSQKSLDILRPTIRKEEVINDRLVVSEMWFSWNPNLPTDPIDAFLRSENPPPDSIVVEMNYRDNPWLPGVLASEIDYDKKRDPDKFAHIWLGKYQRNSESRVFRNWRIEEFDTPSGMTFRMGADWGFSVDPSVLVRCYLDGRNLYVDYEAYMVGCEIDQLPDLFDRVPDSRKWFITADSARPETISYMQRHGYPKINSAIKGAGSIEDGIEFLKSYDIIVHPRCVHTIDELSLYSFKTDPLTGQVLPILSDKKNHVIDSLRYACEGIRKAVKPKESKEYHIPHEGGWMG